MVDLKAVLAEDKRKAPRVREALSSLEAVAKNPMTRHYSYRPVQVDDEVDRDQD
jgi:hypothetical protein